MLHQLLSDPRIKILKTALKEESNLVLVGGAVRDALLGRAIKDIDCATSLSPEQVIERLNLAKVAVYKTGLKHSTVTAVPCDEMGSVEITTFRGENDPNEPIASLRADLGLRDFTVNSFAFQVFGKQEIVASELASSDLENKTIRAVGSPLERFREDPLRILRMIRFACELGFSIDQETQDAGSALREELLKISPERIRDELSKILLSERVSFGFNKLVELRLLEVVLPELLPMVACEQNRFHKKDVFLHTLEVVERTAPELILRLAALLHDVGKPHTISIDEETRDRHFYRHEVEGAKISAALMERLRFPNEVRDGVVMLVAQHMRPIECGEAGIRRLLRDVSEQFATWRALKQADMLSCRESEEQVFERLAVFDRLVENVKKGPEVSPLKNLALKGADLLELGFREGRLVGETLRALHELVLDDPSLNEKERLIPLALNHLRGNQLEGDHGRVHTDES
jgi:tRNA nucleotidyltransferase (CCA-adding enzyme)